jgi:hypothetical protein
LVKRIHIDDPLEKHYMLIGIASDERIWKLCWEINQELKINLRKVDPEAFLGEKAEGDEAPEAAPRLFEPSQMPPNDTFPEYYEDAESDSRYEYALFANDRRISPKKVRPFSYFLLIRYGNTTAPHADQLLETLRHTPAIRSAADITGVENINDILP